MNAVRKVWTKEKPTKKKKKTNENDRITLQNEAQWIGISNEKVKKRNNEKNKYNNNNKKKNNKKTKKTNPTLASWESGNSPSGASQVVIGDFPPD